MLENKKTQENLNGIIETIKNEAPDGVDFMALINSISYSKSKHFLSFFSLIIISKLKS